MGAAVCRVAGFEKLAYVDRLMRSLADREPRVATLEEVDPVRQLRKTLRQHYKKKRRHYGVGRPTVYDRDLRRLFSDAPEFADNMTALRFFTRIQSRFAGSSRAGRVFISTRSIRSSRI